MLFAPLDRTHLRALFDCGVPELNRFLQENALQFVKKGLCAVHILADETSIVGYYALSASSIIAANLPESVAKKYPDRLPIPCWLLGKLAVDQRYQGRQFGKLLLMDALSHIVEMSKNAGGYCVIVDAKDGKAKDFYLKYGFQTFPNSELRLYLPLASIS
ncbi:N-acetyltransferase [Campylobacterota bacterium]|nr:N-acetyltransferase [Campylobacterota bacterium]